MLAAPEHKAHIDFETGSLTDLKSAGVHRYAEDPTTRVWGFTWGIGRGPRQWWTPGMPEPIDLINHIAGFGVVVCHNAAFERWIWNVVIRRAYPHWPEMHIEQQDCTMSRAAAISHPQPLEKLLIVLNAKTQKDMEGHALMLKMSRPRRIEADGTIIWWDEPQNIKRLGAYCVTDVAGESEADDLLPPLTDYERRVWELDQRINDRGIPIDMDAIPKAVDLVELAKKAADREMRIITDRAVPRCSNDNKLIAWINSRGIECTTVKKGVQEDLIFLASLNDDSKVREAIKLRAEAKKTSTAKFSAMLKCVGSDDRIRGLLNYHGAGPGRWAGRLVQPQNFPRVDSEKEGWIFSWLAEMMGDPRYTARDVYEALSITHGETGKNSPLRLMSRLLRSMIKAPKGKKFVGGDFSNIEGRINAWLAGEQWKLDAFKAYDTIIGVDEKGKELRAGPDLYNLAYAKSFGVDVSSVEKDQRQIGKVQELASGFQGGVGAYINMGDNYNLSPYDLSGPVMRSAPAEQWDGVAATYQHATDKNGLPEKEWTALTILVRNWRKAHPNIVQSWWDLQDAAIAAVSIPGQIVPVLNGRVSYYYDGNCLWCVLPSGRMICYAYPELVTAKTEYVDKYTGEVKTRLKSTVYFWGWKEGQWRKLALYGGLQCENIVQGTARCVMVDRMFAVEEAGYPIILTVHDELLAEVEECAINMNSKDFERIMSVPPKFVTGLPLAAAAWEDVRYVK